MRIDSQYRVVIANVVLTGLACLASMSGDPCLGAFLPMIGLAVLFVIELVAAILAVTVKTFRGTAEMWWLGVGSLLVLGFIAWSWVASHMYCNMA
jgi:hypothetical protein